MAEENGNTINRAGSSAKKRGVRKIAGFTLKLVLSLIIADWLVQWYDYFFELRYSRQVEPFYPTSYYSMNGRKLGDNFGYLRLRYSGVLGYENLPNQFTDYFRINEQGFRGPDLRHAKPKNRIVLLGGSTAFGTGLRRDEHTIAARLEDLLEEEFGDTEVVNAAVIGYTSGQEQLLLNNKIMDLEPDLVLSLGGSNDAATGARSQAQNPAYREINSNLEWHSESLSPYFPVRLYAGLKFLFFPAISRRVRSYMSRRAAAFSDSEIEEIAGFYMQNQLKMNRLCSAYGGKHISLLQPDLNSIFLLRSYRPGAGENDTFIFTKNYDRMRARVAMLALAEGFPVYDLNNYEALQNQSYYMDPIHLNEAGSQVAARVIKDLIVKSMLLDRVPAGQPLS